LEQWRNVAVVGKKEPDKILGMALGTAGAHEIGHFLLQQTIDSARIQGIMRKSPPKDFGLTKWPAFNTYQNILLKRKCAPISLPTVTIPGQITPGGGGGGGGGGSDDGGGGRLGGGDPFDEFRWLELWYEMERKMWGDGGDHLA
jgi:hypothetical protein